VQANASRDSVKSRFAVEAHLSRLFSDQAEEATGEAEQEEQDASHVESASPHPSQPLEKISPIELPTALSPEQHSELSQQNAERHDWIE
jgi:dethiobiotin synthetase